MHANKNTPTIFFFVPGVIFGTTGKGVIKFVKVYVNILTACCFTVYRKVAELSHGRISCSKLVRAVHVVMKKM